MLQKNNIRFSYQQKNKFLVDPSERSTQRQAIGKLQSEEEPVQAFDDQQEEFLMKKSTVLLNESAKKSQIYSEMYLQRPDKIKPHPSIAKPKYSFDHEALAHLNKNNSDVSNIKNIFHAPRSLAKVSHKSKEMSHSELEKWNLNGSSNDISVNDEKSSTKGKSYTKGKSFSINHYDIYRPGFLINRQDLEARNEISRIRKVEEKDTSMVQSQFHQELEEEKPHQPLKIHFENETDHDMLELREEQIELSQRMGKQFPEEELIQEPEPVMERKEKEGTIVQNTLNYKKRQSAHPPKENTNKHQKTSSVVRHHRITSDFRSRHIQKPSQDSFNTKEPKKQRKLSSKHTQRSKKSEESQHPPVRKQFKDEVIVKKSQIQEESREPQRQQPQQKEQQQQSVLNLNQKIPKELQIDESRIFKPDEVKREVISQVSSKQQQKQKQIEIIPTSLAKQIQPFPKEQVFKPFEYRKFNTEDYSKIYELLKGIHLSLKSPVIDSPTLLRFIKQYLEIIAGGGLDHIEGYDMPLHRLKIIKNALLYERIAIVIISFAYAVDRVKECLRYLINLINYSTNNTLLILKMLESSHLSLETSKNPVIAKSDRLILKRNYDSVRNSNDIILDAIFKIAKQEEAFFQSFRDIVRSVGKSSLEQTFYNVLQYFAFFLCVSNLHMSIPFLSVAPNPYLRQTADTRPTLVIDIVEVFCHGTRKSKSHIFRPHTEYFLSEMSQYYEIVSFTCAYPNQIDKVIDILDHKRHIKHRLYRHHALSKHNLRCKDVDRIGRDLRRLILLDSQTNAVNTEGGNTVMIPVWRGNKNDTILAELCPILATIAVKNMDCQQAIKKINQQQMKNESEGIKYLNFGINLE